MGGAIQVGAWVGSAYTHENSAAFSHCVAAQPYGDGTALSLAKTAEGFWLLGFSDPSLKMLKGMTMPVDVVFDGQAQFHLVGTATSATVVAALFPDAAVTAFRKSHVMTAVGKNHTLEFALGPSDKIVTAMENCVQRMAGGAPSVPANIPGASAISAQPGKRASAAPVPAIPAKQTDAPVSGPPRLVDVSGTGFLITGDGYIVTNNHVITDCVRNLQASFVGEAPMKLRVVAADEANDLALLQAKGAKKKFKNAVKLRATPVQPGESVIAIGFPYHGILTSDFTVTTGIVSSLSGILNDTRFLQISAPVQPGNSGGPLLDMSGHVVGVVAAKLNALKFAKATGDIPQNINFAIKTGTVRDFLDNSVVSYQAEQPAGQMKTEDIASAARGYIVLVSCTASVKDTGKR